MDIPSPQLEEALGRAQENFDRILMVPHFQVVKSDDTRCFFNEDEDGMLEARVFCGPYAMPTDNPTSGLSDVETDGQWVTEQVIRYTDSDTPGEMRLIFNWPGFGDETWTTPPERPMRPDGLLPVTERLEPKVWDRCEVSTMAKECREPGRDGPGSTTTTRDDQDPGGGSIPRFTLPNS